MFGKPWTPAAHAVRTKTAGSPEKRSLITRVWAVAFSCMLALSGPVGMMGNAHRAWAEQADIATVASVYAEQNDKASNPQAEETGSLDPPQQATANEGDVASDNASNASAEDAPNEASDSDEAPATVDAMRSATVTLDTSEDGWTYLPAGGAREGDPIVLSEMLLADAIWIALLHEA